MILSFLSLLIAVQDFWWFLSPNDPWIILAFYGAVFPFFGLVASVGLIILLSAIIRPLRPFYSRIRQDWTQVSLGLIGIMPLAIIIGFEEYPNTEPYAIAASLVLAASIWFYLRNDRSWQRSLALFAGVTLSMAVVTLGKGIIYSSLDLPWEDRFPLQTEALNTVIGWVVLVIIIFSPVVLKFLPKTDR